MNNNRNDMKILIVEDFQTVRKIEAEFLRSLGYRHIFEAGDGEQAIAIIKQEPDVELVLCDWNMPIKSGFDFLKWIRSQSQYDHVRVIMATSHGDQIHLGQALEAGASGLIGKPFEADELQVKINEVFGALPQKNAEDIYQASLRPVAAKSGKTRLRVAHLQITDHLVLGMLTHLITAGELTPRYFELETRCYPSWNQVVEAMEKETTDMACMLAPIAMDMFGAGIGLRMILLTHQNGSIFVRNRQGIYASAADFYKNKSFLIPHKLSIHHLLSHMYFEQQGLKSGLVGDPQVEVAYEVAAPIAMPHHLRENIRTSGFMVAEPIGSIAVAQGVAVREFLSGQVWENHPCCVVAAGVRFLAEHEEAVYEFTQMLIQAGKKIELEKALAARIGVRFLDPAGKLGVTEPLLIDLLHEPHGLKTSDLIPRLADFERIQRYMTDVMKIGRPIDLERFIDRRFAGALETSAPSDRKIRLPSLVIRPAEPIDYANTRVLLVEDSETMRKIETVTLNAIGFREITQTSNGAEAIEYLRDQPDIQLVISDWNMPEKDGLELLQWIRADSRFASLPFIMATSHGDIAQTQKALNAGANALIAKPFDVSELKHKIDVSLGWEGPGLDAKTDTQPAAGRVTADGKILIRIAHIPITDHLILGALQHLIAKQVIRPETYELVPELMPGWNLVEEKLDKGSVDVAFILAPIAMDLFGAGAPIRVILLAHKNGSIFVKNKTARQPDPFSFYKNTSFLIPHKMSVHHMLSHIFFKTNGLNPGFVGKSGCDVFFEVVAPVEMPEYLKNNANASGFMVAEPLGSKAITAGIAELEFLSGVIWENHPCCVVAVQQDFILNHEDAVNELTQHLVYAGQWIEQNPLRAAEIGVKFLDPDGKLGFTTTLLRNVLTEPDGLKTGDLYPLIDDFEWIQSYLTDEMGIGRKINLKEFIDIRFADRHCQQPLHQSHKPLIGGDLKWLQTIGDGLTTAEIDRFYKLCDKLVLIRNAYDREKTGTEALSPYIIAELNQLIQHFRRWGKQISRWKASAASPAADIPPAIGTPAAELTEELTVLVFHYGRALFGIPISSIKRIEPIRKNLKPPLELGGEEIIIDGKKTRLISLEKWFKLSATEDQKEMLFLFAGQSDMDAVIITTGIKDIRKVKIAHHAPDNPPSGVIGTSTADGEEIPVLDISQLLTERPSPGGFNAKDSLRNQQG